jgi:hypothetical protein
MKRLHAMIGFFLLVPVILGTACGPAEWKEVSIRGQGYLVNFKMPKPFKASEGRVDLRTGRTPYEYGYVTAGDEDTKFQIRVLELAVVAWTMDGYDLSKVVKFAISRENTRFDTILDVHEFIDPTLPEQVMTAQEFMVKSDDLKTIRNSRVVVFETRAGRDSYRCYVLLTASRPRNAPRSPDVDKFFNSLRICIGDQPPGRG